MSRDGTGRAAGPARPRAGQSNKGAFLMQNTVVLSRLVAVLILTIVMPGEAAAWSTAGHRIVARAADSRLSPDARRAARDLLDGASLADVSMLPDEWRDSRPETARFHYVNIPVGGYYLAERDCAATAAGDCIVAAIERFRVVLADSSRPRDERREALIFLVHLVADAGQPLHAADDDDRGGNAKPACVLDGCASGGTTTNLHRVWDFTLIDLAGLTERRYAKRIRKQVRLMSADEAAVLLGTGPRDWVGDSNRQASGWAYGLLPEPDATGVHHLDSAYVDQARLVVDRQLAASALRLSHVLDEALAPSGAR